MILSPTNRFVFFKPLKTAGSSVEFALALSCGPNDLIVGGMSGEEQEAGFVQQNNIRFNPITGTIELSFHTHTTPEVMKKRFNENDWKEIETYTWITMTRNPWDTLVSYYWWSVSQSPEKNKELIIKQSDKRQVAIKKFEKMIFGPVKPLKGVEPDVFENLNCCDYIQKYNTAQTDKRIDKIIRFENIEKDFENLADELGLYNVELPRFKTTQKKIKRHYSYYYTDKTKKLVEDKFKEYIERFDYKFERKNIHTSSRRKLKRKKK